MNKIRILFNVLLAAVLLMAGDFARATDSATSNDLPHVDPEHYWFSRSGSWIALYPDDDSTLRLYYSYWSDGWDEANWMNIRFLRDGKAIETHCSDSPVSLNVADGSTGQNEAHVILSGERDTLIDAADLGIQLSPVQKDYNFGNLTKEDDRTWSTHWREWTVQLVIVDGIFAGLEDGLWEVTPNQGKCRVAIRIFKEAPGILPEDWNAVETNTLKDWLRFRRKMPSVPKRFESEAERAWLNTWYSIAPATPPNFPTQPVLMSKAYMNALWPWDCCFTWTSSVHLLLLHEYGAEFK